ncbi:hypothetical protein Tco_0561561 [Tanacetum coccineum]
MSTSTHPIIILSDSDVEDAFSSTNTPDYSPTSPDYSPASPGNTSSDPSKNSSKDRSASLSISHFHDDPYMKVMQAYNATSNELPIPPLRAPIAPPTILPPSLVIRVSSSSHKTYLEHLEEQIETILNHLDELPFEHIKNMEDKIKGLGLLWFLPSGLLKPLYPDIMDMINNQDIEHNFFWNLRLPDDFIFVELDNSLWIQLKPLRNEPVPKKPNELDAC